MKYLVFLLLLVACVTYFPTDTESDRRCNECSEGCFITNDAEIFCWDTCEQTRDGNEWHRFACGTMEEWIEYRDRLNQSNMTLDDALKL